jgi:predicted permease
MAGYELNLLGLYAPLVGWTGLGLLLGSRLPKAIADGLGKGLFWVGVPLSVVGFLRNADLSGPIWIAPLIAWAAILLGLGLAWLGIWGLQHRQGGSCGVARTGTASEHTGETLAGPQQPDRLYPPPTCGSFLLSAMVGNTGYLGYPVTLALVGPGLFGWALFYDMLGTMFGAYGLGVFLAARFGQGTRSPRQMIGTLLLNPALWGFIAGLWLRDIPLPPLLDTGLKAGAWVSIALSLILIGMRLSQLHLQRSLKLASFGLGIKMLVVPLLLGAGISWLGIRGAPRLVMVLQMGMPPAFATLMLTEAYDLDRELTVTALAGGSLALLALLPLWLWLFPI